MLRFISRIAVALAFFPFCTCTAQVQKSVSMESLLWDMVNLTRLTYYPDPEYTTKQSSSYDRATKSKSEGWFANNDRGQYIRVENNPGRKPEKVLLDTSGPGVVTRIWSANAQEGGTVRIYIDRKTEPALEVEMDSLLGGSVEPFNSPIAGQRAKGWNLYFPIPYAEHCKITIDGGSIYYQINYRTYKKGTRLESFSMQSVKSLTKQIDQIKSVLRDPAGEFKVDGFKKKQAFTIPAGQAVIIYQTNSQVPGSIRDLRMKISADDIDEALRGCVLIGEFDYEKKPSIWCPIGDFFGSAPGINEYNSLPLTVKSNGVMMCRWEMPFKRSVRLKVKNTTSGDVSIAVYVMLTKYNWTNRSMYFHAKWKKDTINTQPKSDWTYLNTKGSGVFVGDMLHILNPVVNWWGEGDEKIFIDGEKFPSHFGTGTEDYYGYAWCSSERFYHAYHSQTRCDGPRNQGNTSVNRFHILDDIPFARSFKFDMEVWHWKECKVVYSATSYWYAAPGCQDSFIEPPENKLTIDEL